MFFSINKQRVIALDAPSISNRFGVLSSANIVVSRIMAGLFILTGMVAFTVAVALAAILRDFVTAGILLALAALTWAGSWALEKNVTHMFQQERSEITLGLRRAEYVTSSDFSHYVLFATLKELSNLTDEIRREILGNIAIAEADTRIRKLSAHDRPTPDMRADMLASRLRVFDEIEGELQNAGIASNESDELLYAERKLCLKLTHEQAKNEVLRLDAELEALDRLVDATEPQPSA